MADQRKLPAEPAWLELDRRHAWHPYAHAIAADPVYPVASARGVHLQLADGRELIDGRPTLTPECTFAVDDVDATARAVVAGGGRILMERFTISGVGHLIFFEDPAGNAIGAMQYDPAAE